MALYKAGEILRMADKAKTSAIAFNCSDFNMVHSVAVAAERVHKPVICMLHPDHHRLENWITPEVFAKLVKYEAAEISAPLAMHLDHCSDFDYIMRAIKAGFTSVMYDGSMLPFEENIRNTRAVVDVAHAMGVTVEAELGHVGLASTVEDQNNLDMYTQADVAAEFCDRSGCDSIAIAIGSAHGFYKETPHLDISGSGIPSDQLEVAFREGINKFNVGTEFFWLYNQTVQTYREKDITQLPRRVQEALTGYLVQKLELSKF